MNKRVYGAFTLVEMLVVMGILIILMVIGISAGSFALNRAADVSHRNAADQLAEGLQAYYVDNRAYPKITDCGVEGSGTVCTPALLMQEGDKLGKYMDLGAFNGGSGATFIYLVGGSNADQAFLICVSMRGIKSENDVKEDASYYCSGNGFSETPLYHAAGTAFGPAIDRAEISVTDDDLTLWNVFSGTTFASASDWDNQEWTAL